MFNALYLTQQDSKTLATLKPLRDDELRGGDVARCWPLTSRLKAEDRSIPRMQVCHQRVHVGEAPALPGLKLGDGFACGGVGNLHIEGQSTLISHAQHQ